MTNQQPVEVFTGIVHNVRMIPTSTGRSMAVFTLSRRECKCFGEIADYMPSFGGEQVEISAVSGKYRGRSEYAVVSLKATIDGRAICMKDDRSVPRTTKSSTPVQEPSEESVCVLSEAEVCEVKQEILRMFREFARRHIIERDLLERVMIDTRIPAISWNSAIRDVLAESDANAAKRAPQKHIEASAADSNYLQDSGQPSSGENHAMPTSPYASEATIDPVLQAQRESSRLRLEKLAADKEDTEYQKVLRRYQVGSDSNLEFWLENIKTPLDQRAIKQVIEERKLAHGIAQSGSDPLTAQRAVVQGVITKILKLVTTPDGRKMVGFQVGSHVCMVFGKVAEYLDANKSDYLGKPVAVFGAWKINESGLKEFVPSESTPATESDPAGAVTTEEVQKALERALMDGSGLSAVGDPTSDEMWAEAERERRGLERMAESSVLVA